MIFLLSMLHYPIILLKKNYTDLIEQTFNREGSLYLACNKKRAFFTSEQPKIFEFWSCQKIGEGFHYLLENTFIKICS